MKTTAREMSFSSIRNLLNGKKMLICCCITVRKLLAEQYIVVKELKKRESEL